MEYGTVLVVDDEESVRFVVSQMLMSQGFKAETANGGVTAMEMLETTKPDLVLTDIKMPQMDGVQLARNVKERAPDTPVIILTGYASVDTAIESLKLGVDDYLKKPVEVEQLVEVVRSALAKRALTRQNKSYVEDLERRMLAAKREPAASFLSAVKCLFGPNGKPGRHALMDTVGSLAATIGTRDAKAKEHSEEVAALVAILAEAMLFPPDIVQQLRAAGLLHDIGKIGIPQEILSKDEQEMTKDELAAYREHPVISARILQPVRMLEPIVDAVLHHHEQFNGKGYPDKLSGVHVPIGARIIAVADSFTRKRAGSDGASDVHGALEFLMAHRGSFFDPEVVDTFLKVLPARKH